MTICFALLQTPSWFSSCFPGFLPHLWREQLNFRISPGSNVFTQFHQFTKATFTSAVHKSSDFSSYFHPPAYNPSIFFPTRALGQSLYQYQSWYLRKHSLLPSPPFQGELYPHKLIFQSRKLLEQVPAMLINLQFQSKTLHQDFQPFLLIAPLFAAQNCKILSRWLHPPACLSTNHKYNDFWYL